MSTNKRTGLYTDGPAEDFERKHLFWTSNCQRKAGLKFDRDFQTKLQEFVDAGINIDHLPRDLKMFVIVHMTVDEARKLTR